MITIAFIFLFIYNNSSFPLLNDNNVLGTVLTFVGTGLALDSLLFGFIKKLWDVIRNPEDYKKKKYARKELRRIAKSELNITHSPIIGGTWGEFSAIYDLHLKVNSIISEDDDRRISKLPLCNSYILRGEAGAGKSTYMRKLFCSRHKNLFYILADLLTSKAVLFFNAKELFREGTIKRVSQLVKYAQYRKVYLLCDGLDELGEDEDIIRKTIEDIYFLHQAQYNGKMNLIVSGRDSCIIKYEHSLKFAQLFSKHYSVVEWSNADIERLLYHIINSSKKEWKKSVRKLAEKKDFAQKVAYNPMKCKMLCIIVIAKKDIDVVNIEQNSYMLYLAFFKCLFEHEYQRMQYQFYDESLDNTLKEIARFAFERYISSGYNTNAERIEERMIKLIWNKDNFIHHTYEEFFVAYYYLDSLRTCDKNDIKRAVEVLSRLYNNSYADYISAGFKSEKGQEKETINKLVYIYYFTLPKENKRALLSMPGYTLHDLMTDKNVERINQLQIKKLDKIHYLNLKYEITFRLGRLNTDYALPILKYIYFYDCLAIYKKFELTSYELTILKRQCAVSASFLCGTEIEIDYVQKMLPNSLTYDANYDLVNRSHTLIYYGDVLNTDVHSFKDDGNANWDHARETRIERLRKRPTAYNMDDKIAYFRLFDLATIYTFLYSRKTTLTEDERLVVKNAVVSGIQNMPKIREELMVAIKQYIIELSDEF